ncbi:MAG: M23 family metallopeptidase [Ilumatobacteraceae bacterium]
MPAATPAPQRPSVNGLICPVAGPNAFGDSWGAARSGGRRHEGVDMMSPFGTPLVAVISGFATMKMNSLGGITVGLKGADGNYYYYAHLSRWEGSSRAVSQGDVVGYVGHTGDTTANHLHFGIYFRGGAAINPYPVVRPIC